MWKSQSRVTEYSAYSAFSGHPAECTHHLIFGNGRHKLADQDGLTIGLLNSEHNLSSKGTINQIHDNPAAEKLSKIAGQLAWERNYLIDKYGDFDELSRECREAFRKRYHESYL
jgi:hypothetical protein